MLRELLKLLIRPRKAEPPASKGGYHMATILRLQDLIDKRSKNEELQRYKADLDALLEKAERLKRYISLTETIIRMIEQEEIVEFRENI